MTTPLEKYQQDLTKAGFSKDAEQEKAAQMLQQLYEELIRRQQHTQGLFNKLQSFAGLNHEHQIKGIYFWGGVGRGKTYMVDTFYDCLPFENKLRSHFHRFMQSIHKELKTLKNVENPLTIVADRLAEKTQVLCFDEFHISDITDAMLLGNLLAALFDRGVVLITTSNQHPDDLYKGGLQRERFLPAIDLIKEHTKVVNLDAGIDYRLRYLNQAEIYHIPLDDKASSMLSEHFQHMSPDEGVDHMMLEIENRQIPTVRCGAGAAWFEFNALCDGPRGPADYIEIARQFHTVLVANIPIMDDMQNDLAKRFITMVDEFYDRHVKLIATAEANPEQLYQGKRLAQ
ncbi:MAG: cell division protein ZapE, partial [Pseudomonadota bacterium]